MTLKQTVVRAFIALQAEGYSLASFVAPLKLRRIDSPHKRNKKIG